MFSSLMIVQSVIVIFLSARLSKNKKHTRFTFEKKVLLREHKRHTARRVVGARYATLSPDKGGGTQSRPGQGGVPNPVLDGGYLIQSWYPIQSWVGGTQGTPHPDLGPDLDGG